MRRQHGRGGSTVEVRGLHKAFGETVALDGISLDVEPATVLCLLGPNGAGKTTLVRILTTLLQPDRGSARILGLELVADAAAIRSRIGVAGQYASVDELLTARENLVMVARLYHQPGRAARRRAAELLERFRLGDAADRPVREFSGGMRRRLDLAASLLNDPPVLFLDEPTTGLDPRSRLALWEIIDHRVAQGTTLLLTTQYLEEADRLASKIAVMDSGQVIASGTADSLKSQAGGQVVDVRVADAREAGRARSVLAQRLGQQPAHAGSSLSIPAPGEDSLQVLLQVAGVLEAAGVRVEDLALRRPTLDEVFLALTGRPGAMTEPAAAVPASGRPPGPAP